MAHQVHSSDQINLLRFHTDLFKKMYCKDNVGDKFRFVGFVGHFFSLKLTSSGFQCEA